MVNEVVNGLTPEIFTQWLADACSLPLHYIINQTQFLIEATNQAQASPPLLASTITFLLFFAGLLD